MSDGKKIPVHRHGEESEESDSYEGKSLGYRGHFALLMDKLQDHPDMIRAALESPQGLVELLHKAFMSGVVSCAREYDDAYATRVAVRGDETKVVVVCCHGGEAGETVH